MAADANRIFNYVVGLGANSVGINFFFYTDGVYPTRVYGVRGGTPSPATIGMVIASARRHGLRVLDPPLFWNEKNIVDDGATGVAPSSRRSAHRVVPQLLGIPQALLRRRGSGPPTST